MPRTEAGKRANFGLPTTTTGQLEHSRQHREEDSQHPLVGYCPVAMNIQDIEAEAVEAERERCLHVLREARDRVRQGDPLTAMLDTLNEAEAAIVNPEADHA